MIGETERWLMQMHQARMDIPMHEPALDEEAFQRIFGPGDEHQVKPVNINQPMIDAGHKESDF